MMIDWLPVLVSVVITMMLGYLWYSPLLFLRQWLKGLPEPAKWLAPMWMPLLAQAGALLLLAILVNQLLATVSWLLLILVVLTIMGFSKANGMYSGKTKMSISIEVLYILISAFIMVAINVIL